MVKNLEPYREGKEPRIIVPERTHGATVTLRNNTGTAIDGLILRLETPSPRRIKRKDEATKPEGKDLLDEDEEDEGDTPRPAKTLATEVWFQAEAYVKVNHVAAVNPPITESGGEASTLRKPEVAFQFTPVEHGETLDLDVALLSPQALDGEAEFTVIPTRNQNVVVEAEAPSPLLRRITAYIVIFLLGELLIVIPLLSPQTTAGLGALRFIPPFMGLNIIALTILAVIRDKALPKPHLPLGLPHLVILTLTVLTFAVMLGAVKLTDIVITQLLLIYAIIVAVYFASLTIQEYLRTRRGTPKEPIDTVK